MPFHKFAGIHGGNLGKMAFVFVQNLRTKLNNAFSFYTRTENNGHQFSIGKTLYAFTQSFLTRTVFFSHLRNQKSVFISVCSHFPLRMDIS